MSLTEYMQALLDRRRGLGSLRGTSLPRGLVDFASNDYLGLARDAELGERLRAEAERRACPPGGSTGSRLLTGHHAWAEELEALLAERHRAPAALLFNSGYDANLSLAAALCRRRDLILYDELIHAGVHDGMRLSAAENRAFRHNDPEHLERLLQEARSEGRFESIFVWVESLYSMDGDQAPLADIAALAQKYEAHLLLDEAHSTGIFGVQGAGLAVDLGLEAHCLARLHTFGKAMGGHGAAVLGSELLRTFLLNFARPLIYSTALPPHSLLYLLEAYKLLGERAGLWLPELRSKTDLFVGLLRSSGKAPVSPSSAQSPIQSFIMGGNERTRAAAAHLQAMGFDVRPVLSPTVPAGTERLRVCLHRFNTHQELQGFAEALCALSL